MSDDEVSDDGRDIAANIFDGAAATAAKLAEVIPDPVAKSALKIGAALAGIVGGLIRSIGTDNTKALMEELQRRKDEGKITDAHVARDNTEIADAVSKLYTNSGSSPSE